MGSKGNPVQVFQKKLGRARDKLKKAVLQTLSPQTGKTTPIFIVGSGRSGTTLLTRELDKSWQVKLYNEGDPAAFNSMYRLLDLSIVESLVQKSPAPVTLFKPILDTCQAQNFLARFPNSKIIFAFRHYNDVINSSLKLFGRTNRLDHVRGWVENDFSEFAVAPPPAKTKTFISDRWNPTLTQEEGGALFWLFINWLYYDLELHQSDRVHLVRYESLVSNPRKEFEALTEFMGIAFEERMIKDIYASSVKKSSSPGMNETLRADCEQLYQKLSRDAS